ncbi:hypothetical protein FA95DRAFT_1559576 [Auriscalpium vulgare]|uniref:Uncharacterized protein n=1 Tax=Auriscalpium vulgare TaxID=40419 RepID=A0ACB8RS13_9AGAM|nr:hypothetical protein FA95DRAFT_1559576 [Auriscalpium vulgare]
MDQPSASSKVIESPDLWFPSGNIIVRTMSQTTPPTIRLYKVHKDILALHCASFAALFDSPHDALDAGSERHDGVPVMDLTDAEDDVVSFVKALYYPR